MSVQDTKFVNGAQRLSQRIATIRAKLSLPALTNEIGELLLRRTLDRFDREVDPDGNRWKPLKPGTRRIKAKLGAGGILKRTHLLRDSIKIIRGGISGSMFTNTGAGVRIGVTEPERVDVARYHQNGTKAMPQRRFLGIGALDVKSVDSFLRRRGQEAIDQS